MKQTRIVFLFFAFTFCWTITEICANKSGVSLLEVLWARCAIDLIGMLVIVGLRDGNIQALVRTSQLTRHIQRSLSLVGMCIFIILAMRGMPVNNGLSVLWGTPLLVLLFDRLFTREVSGWRIPALTIGGYAGVLLILRPSLIFNWNIFLALGAAICLAIYIVMTREMREEKILPKLFHTALWAVVALTPFLPLFWQPPTLYGWVLLFAVGLCGWITLYILCRSVEEVPAAIFAPALYGMVVWPELLQRVTQHAILSRGAWLGLLLMVGSIGWLSFLGRWPSYKRITANWS